jgi:TolA-binding protein
MAARHIEPACSVFARAMVAGCVLLAAPVSARAGAANSIRPRPIVLAALHEENIGPAELPSPTATPTAEPSPGVQGGVESQQPSTQATAGEAVEPPPAESPPPTAAGTSPSIAPTPEAGAQGEPTAGAEPGVAGAQPSALPTELAPVGIGEITPTLQISNSSLEPLIASASTPALAASLRMTDDARKNILDNRPDDAIQLLSRAISIGPGDSYAYFYLGRAWLAKKNYAQAMTFFNRAEMAFASNSNWLGETLAFEGLTYEEWGQPQQAEKEYAQALQANPANLMARVGYTRLTMNSAPEPEAATPAPSAAQANPAPDESAPPPAPAEPPPPAN